MFEFLKRINMTNSSLTVQCTAKGTCEMRHTSLCKTCERNLGMPEYKSYYKPVKTINEKY